MLSAVTALKGLAKVHGLSAATENFVFKLHGQLTCLMLIIFSVLITMDAFFGKPIDCFTSVDKEYPQNFLNNYCWMHTTYTVQDAYDKKVGEMVIAPGVDKAGPNDQRNYHSYYQWVSFFLFFAGVSFYIPHYLWKILEGNRMEKTLLGLNEVLSNDDDEEREANVNKLAEYLKRSRGCNTVYALSHAVCELLNLVIAISQIFVTDAFLGGEFTEYGTEVVAFGRTEFTNRTDPMVKLFPRVAKCTVYKIGPSGSVQNNDVLCVLPINVVNEKIFIFIWFWYILLAVVGVLAFSYRIFLVVCSQLRLMVLRCGCRHADFAIMESLVMDRMDGYADWFVMRMIEKNIKAKNFCDLVKELGRVTDSREICFARYPSEITTAYANGDTMPVETTTRLYGQAKYRLSNGKLT